MPFCPCGKHIDPPATVCEWCADPANAPTIRELLRLGRYAGHYEPHVSPSQLASYLKGCKRAWALDKIGKIPRPGNKYSERGTAVHAILEGWILNAKPPDIRTVYGQIAYPALAHIPPPLSAGVIAEREIRWWPEGVGVGNLWVFLKDLEQPSDQTSKVWDYKSTSNLGYALTTDKLLFDPQGLTYAAHAFLTYLASQVDECWLYLTANKPHTCHPVRATHDRNTCLERFSLLDSVATVMLAHRRAETSPANFPPNPAHCPAYGGCSFRNTKHCSLTEKEIFMSTANPLTPSPGGSVDDFMKQIGMAVANPPAPQQPPVAVTSPFPQVVQAAAQTAPNLPGVNPFGQAATPQTGPAMVFPPPAVNVQAPTPIQFSPPPGFPAPTAAPAAAAPPAAEKSKRVRRTNAQIEADRLAAAAAAASASPFGPQVAVATAVPASTPAPTFPGLPTQPLPPPVFGPAVDPDGQDSRANPQPSEPERGFSGDGSPEVDPLVREIALAMACNPGYCALPSVDFADRATTLAQALRAVAG
jgi:hypothetical protein